MGLTCNGNQNNLYLKLVSLELWSHNFRPFKFYDLWATFRNAEYVTSSYRIKQKSDSLSSVKTVKEVK